MNNNQVKIRSRYKKRRLRNSKEHKAIGLLVFALIVCMAGVSTFFLLIKPGSSETFVDITKIVNVQLPRDEGPHQHATEWWYYNGHLTSSQGVRFSYHVSYSARRALVNHTIMHVSLLNHQTKVTKTFEARLPGFQANESANGSHMIKAGDWSLFLNSALHRIIGEGDDFSLRLDLAVAGPIVLQDMDGIIDFGAAGESYYYSMPRMPSRGTIEFDGEVYQVEGDSWYDHQWGDFRATVLSWQWFGLQLDNETELMIFALTNSVGESVYVGGTLIEQGRSSHIAEEDLEMKPLGFWKSPKSNVSYPVSWRITSEKNDLSLLIVPEKRDMEFDARNSSYNMYWEGPVRVSGSHKGKGYLKVSNANATNAKAEQ